ncbi:MAG: hypothetical protein J7641_01070, partial [Cyanobacteria bacterium SID2]|nr:hypothetical protein [Cyanobacteria bacterium SID2]
LDEYPFASVHEGGRAKYDANQVSVRAVGEVESRRQGNLMRAFYSRANIIPDHPEKGLLNKIITT